MISLVSDLNEILTDDAAVPLRFTLNFTMYSGCNLEPEKYLY